MIFNNKDYVKATSYIFKHWTDMLIMAVGCE